MSHTWRVYFNMSHALSYLMSCIVWSVSHILFPPRFVVGGFDLVGMIFVEWIGSESSSVSSYSCYSLSSDWFSIQCIGGSGTYQCEWSTIFTADSDYQVIPNEPLYWVVNVINIISCLIYSDWADSQYIVLRPGPALRQVSPVLYLSVMPAIPATKPRPNRGKIECCYCCVRVRVERRSHWICGR